MSLKSRLSNIWKLFKALGKRSVTTRGNPAYLWRSHWAPGQHFCTNTNFSHWSIGANIETHKVTLLQITPNLPDHCNAAFLVLDPRTFVCHRYLAIHNQLWVGASQTRDDQGYLQVVHKLRNVNICHQMERSPALIEHFQASVSVTVHELKFRCFVDYSHRSNFTKFVKWQGRARKGWMILSKYCYQWHWKEETFMWL